MDVLWTFVIYMIFLLTLLLTTFSSLVFVCYKERKIKEKLSNQFKNLVENKFPKVNWVTLKTNQDDVNIDKEKRKEELIADMNNMDENKMWYLMYKKIKK